MLMPANKHPYLIWLPVALVAILLSLSIWFTFHNQQVIRDNEAIQNDAEVVRSNVSEVLWGTIHGVDIGLRGYALIREERFLNPLNLALADKDSLFGMIEEELVRQGFDMPHFYRFRDSIQAYIDRSMQMKQLLDSGRDQRFTDMLYTDKGYNLWLAYQDFSQSVDKFEEQIKDEARARSEAAIAELYIAQLALLLVLVPTLALYVYYFRKSLRMSHQLAESREAKAALIRHQKEELELKVKERTEALAVQMNIIKSQHDELIAINQAKDKIFSVLSHDLRGPLGNLQSALVGFRSKLFSPKESDQLLDKLEVSFNQTSELLNNLLVWSKSQMRGISVDKKLFDLSASVQDLIQLFHDSRKAKNITIVNNSDHPLEVSAGKEMIEMVLRNLLVNAIKFTPDGGTINIAAHEQNDLALVEISDSGVGMNPETVDQIMRKGYAASTPGTNEEKGSGMGLMLAQEFIKLHNGTFDIISKQGRGTTIRFTIPKN